jgi:DNA-directed RNA polymerase specialized sigma24 family protein
VICMDIEECIRRVAEHSHLIEQIAGRSFPDANLADKAVDFIEEKLMEDGYRRIRLYQGISGFPTYLRVVVKRLLIDFSRHELGRARIPDWVKDLGEVGKTVYELLCIQRLPLAEVIETLKMPAHGHWPSAALEDAAEAILSKDPDCGKAPERLTLAPPEVMDTMLSTILSPEQEYSKKSLEALIGAILSSGKTEGKDRLSAREAEMAAVVRSRLDLTAEERLFLRMVYWDALSVSSAGESLHWNVNQAHGKMRRLLERLNKAFQESGLEESLRDMLCDEQS